MSPLWRFVLCSSLLMLSCQGQNYTTSGFTASSHASSTSPTNSTYVGSTGMAYITTIVYGYATTGGNDYYPHDGRVSRHLVPWIVVVCILGVGFIVSTSAAVIGAVRFRRLRGARRLNDNNIELASG